MPRKRAASIEADDIPSSSSRPSRIRNVPERLELSSFDRSHRRSRSSDRRIHRQGEDKWAERLQECEEEEEYVRHYSYAHVGKALKGPSPNCWVEVPLPKVKNRNLIPVTIESLAVDTNEKVDHVVRLASQILDAGKEKDVAIEIAQVKQLEGRPEEDVAPTQDTSRLAEQMTASSPIEVNELDERVRSSPNEDNVPAITRSQNFKPTGGIASSPSPSLSFVDALMEEEEKEEVEARVAMEVVPGRRLAPIDHPETRLSHSKNEDYGASSASSQPKASTMSQSKDNRVTEQALFLGSEEEDDRSTRPSIVYNGNQQTAKKGQSSKSSQSTLIKANIPISSTERGKQKQVASVRQTEKVNNGLSKGNEDRRKDKSKAYNENILEGRKKRRRTMSVEEKRKSQNLKKERKRIIEEDDLEQDLHVDAIANSTSNKRNKAKRAMGLKKLQKAKKRSERKKAGKDVSSSESSSESDSDDSNDSDSDDPTDFIVEDDEDEVKTNFCKIPHKGAKRIPMPHRRSLSPPSIVSKDLLSNVRSWNRPERLKEYIRWIISYALEMEVTSSQESARVNLREKFKLDFRSLTTQSNRRHFTWYLKHYPYFERRPMTYEEKKDHVGCSACHKTKQRCGFAFTFWGTFYKLETLEKTSKYSSSDMSTGADDWTTKSDDNKRTTFYVGETCGKTASVKHKLFHWERRVLNDVVALPLTKILGSRYETRPNYNAEVDIEAVVDFYYPTLSHRAAKLEADARILLTDSSNYTRLRERWDDKP